VIRLLAGGTSGEIEDCEGYAGRVRPNLQVKKDGGIVDANRRAESMHGEGLQRNL
jgi:hypothetical protein